MLLHNSIPIQCLEDSKTGLELFNELVKLGKISNTDVTLLSEVAETTEQTSAKKRIAKYKKKIQCSETGTRLTPYRKALFEALRNVGRDGLHDVINFYKLIDRNYDNIWDVVFHLEQQELLDDTQEKCKLFADLLNKKAQNILLNAVNNREAVPLQKRIIQKMKSKQIFTPNNWYWIPALLLVAFAILHHLSGHMKENNHCIHNDFNHNKFPCANWTHHGAKKWMLGNERYNVGYDLGKNYSGGSGNYYIYVAKSDEESIKEGWLNSPKIPDEWDNVCIAFDFYNSNNDSRIKLYRITNDKDKEVIQIPYNKGEWKRLSIDKPVNTNTYHYLIGGLASGDGQQLVVLDNILISKGKC
ncbi:uncharacterized protein [Antedon mediterranea]|uniref:uncharacterized protein n=1 Tax=Antedon mediterranea TaxID=105859 RepID=UPI003AF7724B